MIHRLLHLAWRLSVRMTGPSRLTLWIEKRYIRSLAGIGAYHGYLAWMKAQKKETEYEDRVCDLEKRLAAAEGRLAELEGRRA